MKNQRCWSVAFVVLASFVLEGGCTSLSRLDPKTEEPVIRAHDATAQRKLEALLTLRTQLPAGPPPPADWVGKTLSVASAANLPMLWIAPGTFTMGDASDGPAHLVHIARGYWLGRTEVTQAQWQAVMGNNPSEDEFKGPNQPVENVSWDDAMEFCRRVTASERSAGRVPMGYEYTLPTEAEWEYACRAGTTGDYGGNGNLDHMGWYEGNSRGKTHDIASKAPNAWGLYDMHGNVWEWCYDLASSYANNEQTDPASLGVESDNTSGSGRVNRGGSWVNTAVNCQSTYRSGGGSGYRGDGLGFRLALSPIR
jgi:formylglycine-generating enzyme required for sulfatase activity